MRTPLLITLLATTALASPYPAPNSHIDIIQIRQVEVDVDRRQAAATTSLDQAFPTSIDLSTLIPSACLEPSDIAPEPSIPAALESAIAAWTPTNPCEAPSYTGSIGAAYTSYASALSAWAKTNSAKLASWQSEYQTACPYAATLSKVSVGSASLPSGVLSGTAYNTALLYSLASCGVSSTSGVAATATQKASGGSTGAASLQTGGTATATASGSASKAGSTGAAPQQTAFAAAAGILAGFAGVVAAL